MSSAIPDCKLEEFKDFVFLGKGGEGYVRKGYHGRFGYVAVKTFENGIDPSREINLLAKCPKHPNLVQLFAKIPGRYGSGEYIGYVIEYVEGGSLYNVIYNPKKNYNWSQIYRWIEQIGLGLQHLHETGIIHRDVKPDNILVTPDNLKLTDFGIAKYNQDSNTVFVGTYRYMAPEVISTRKYTFPADIYSFAITIWEMTHRQKPYTDLKRTEMINNFQAIVDGKRPVLDLTKINDDLCKIIEGAWHSDVSMRLPLKDIINYAHMEADKITRHEVADRTVGDVSTQQESVEDLLSDNPRKRQDTIVVIGTTRWAEWRLQNSMFILSPRKPRWRALSLNLPTNMTYGGAVLLHEEMYIFGGTGLSKKLYKMNEDLEWIQLASMNAGRTWITNSCLEWNGFIWVLGGYNVETKGVLKSVECYDPKLDKWTLMPEMREERHDAAAAVCNGKIIVYGGRRDFFTQLKSAECFDPESGVWTQLDDMPRILRAHCIVPNRNDLIIMGGCDSYRKPLNCVWKVTPNEEGNGEWQELQPMKHACMWPSAVMLNGDIYAIGGMSLKEEDLKKVEVFHEGSWRKGPPLPIALCGLVTVVIPDHLADKLYSKVQ